jgi:hypothetical protein
MPRACGKVVDSLSKNLFKIFGFCTQCTGSSFLKTGFVNLCAQASASFTITWAAVYTGFLSIFTDVLSFLYTLSTGPTIYYKLIYRGI